MKLQRMILMAALVVFGALGLVALSPPSQAHAACSGGSDSFFGLPAWHRNLPKEDSGGSCQVKFDKGNAQANIVKVLLNIFDMLLRIAGMVAVAFVMVGGFQFITSTGSPDQAAKARKTLINALVGVAIVLVAAPLIGFISSNIGG